MYIPKEFEVEDLDEIVEFIRQNSFGMIISSRNGEFQVAHVPILIEKKEGKIHLFGHMAIGNEHWRIAQGDSVLVIFNGPHYYISPKWYRAEAAVPTWNYMTAHCEGVFSTLNHIESVSVLNKTLEYYEIDSDLQGKMEESFYSKMAHGVKGFSITISRIYAKYKLSQNRTHEDRISIVENLRKINTEESNRMAEEIQKRDPEFIK